MKSSYKNILFYLLFAVIFGVVGYQMTIRYLPNFIFNKVHKRSLGRNAADNTLLYHDLPTDTLRSVVMPNPDFLYISSFYDVSKNPLHLTGTLPDSTYWSVAFYQPNTINWYIKNDIEYSSNQLNLVLTKQNQKFSPDFANLEAVVSPTDKGFMLIRILVTDSSPETLKKYKIWQQSVKLETIETHAEN